MTRTHRNALSLGAFWLLASSVPLAANPVEPVLPAHPFAEAERSETEGRWEDALRLYCDLYEAGERTPEVRSRIHGSLRRVLQSRRQRDDSFRDMLGRLDLTTSLDLYADLLGQIGSLYPDPQPGKAGALLYAGFEEFDRALGDPSFVDAHLAGATADQVDRFRDRLRAGLASRAVVSPRDARAVVREVAGSVEREFGKAAVVPSIVEFLCGACHSLDEYSALISAAEEYGPVSQPALDLWAFGVRLAIRGEELIVAEVIPGSLAEDQEMLRPGSRVLMINGRVVVEPTAESVAELLTMRQRDWIELVISDDPMMAPRSVSLPVQLPTVLGSVILKPGIGYLRILSFRASTPAELDEQVVGLQGQGMAALIVDLRGNPGGGLLTAVAVAERFLAEGEVVAVIGRHQAQGRTFFSAGGMGAWSFPVVLLIDGETASAAEVLAAALKAQRRAVLVGEPTYGKASMQTLIRSKAFGYATLRLTVARLLGPDGTEFDGVGVAPDVHAVGDRQLDVAVEQARQTLELTP